MDKNCSYLNSQLIAYIGNKRRLLSFLEEVFSDLRSRIPGVSTPIRFGDCFAGSGSVSRLAKTMGFSVAANDWELYSRVINTAHICLSSSDAEALFTGEGGFEKRLEQLNALSEPSESDCYISRYFAPDNTDNADYRYERLFYTRENALFIDAVRTQIENWYPGWELGSDDYRRKCLLLAPLLYQAATHANTNGVFKAYHKGFGGHSGDALSRIMARMKLQHPVLFNNSDGCSYEVERQNAVDFAAGRSFDICYLDPPYNQHQYGSNYFMLNTIAKWDKPAVSMDRTVDGRLKVKAGIRPDWAQTRSDFCYARTAPAELDRLISSIDSRYIVLSYNTEGIIPFNELFDILSAYGKTEIFCRDYIIYRGGKQSLDRSNRNVEFQLVLSMHESAGRTDKSQIDKILRVRSIISLMNESFVPSRLKADFSCSGSRVRLEESAPGLMCETALFYKFNETPELESLASLTEAELEHLLRKLENCRCRDRQEEAEVLMSLISGFSESDRDALYRKLWSSLFKVVRKFAFRKYRDVFEDIFAELQQLAAEQHESLKPGNWSFVEKKTLELRRVADLRFGD